MKKNKEQKKGQESTIGKIIYGFLLFMPLLAIGSTLLISTFNMSAKQQTEITYKYETNEVNSLNDIKEGNLYAYDTRESQLFPSDYINQGSISFTGTLLYCEFDSTFSYDDNYSEIVDIYHSAIELNSDDYIYITNDNNLIYNNGNNKWIYCQTMLNEDLNAYQYIIFQCDSYSNLENIENLNTFLLCFRGLTEEELTKYQVIESVETHNLDTQEVFYNAVDKVTESPLFNWAQNSVIYTTTNATCNALSITTPFIPLLMSYWLIISVIYFLYDIALMLVWLIHKKIHELQESF